MRPLLAWLVWVITRAVAGMPERRTMGAYAPECDVCGHDLAGPHYVVRARRGKLYLTDAWCRDDLVRAGGVEVARRA
jgi:hypothetical protein